ncbi:elongation factor Ts [Candidatus Microgenomates bacterium]|nr:elongation factor Ts [Candidatus Microgenomates bacterium]
MKISPQDVKKLRASTGAGVMAAKAALEEAGGDFDKAIKWLRQQGHAKASSRAGKATRAGVIDGYVHLGKVGVLVEVTCETDFVARTDDFKRFAHEIAMQVAASNPRYLKPADVPKSEVKAARGQELFRQICLLKQPSIHDQEVTVEARLKDLIAKVGENVVIRRFVRFELGEK